MATQTGTAIVGSGAPVSFHWQNPGVVGATPTVLPAAPIDLEVQVRGGSQHFKQARFFLDGANHLGYGNLSTTGIGAGRISTFELHTDAPATAGPGDHVISVRVVDNHDQEFWAQFTFRSASGGGGGGAAGGSYNIMPSANVVQPGGMLTITCVPTTGQFTVGGPHNITVRNLDTGAGVPANIVIDTPNQIQASAMIPNTWPMNSNITIDANLNMG
ncbi:MAG: hypothetical protein KJ601_03160 [Nanoarchaeota archaeon]|nr:hypothetical protein [Nanoarchaeota archaeon]MBU1704387.1 hypothetical protein [Nanoarchaeota archaeon]